MRRNLGNLGNFFWQKIQQNGRIKGHNYTIPCFSGFERDFVVFLCRHITHIAKYFLPRLPKLRRALLEGASQFREDRQIALARYSSLSVKEGELRINAETGRVRSNGLKL